MHMEHQIRPLVLLTNDDGYDSPAIIELASHIHLFADVLFVAPKEHHSGIGRGIYFGAKARQCGMIEEHRIELSPGVEITGYAVHGTPAQCSVHAILELAPRIPDVCISGINYGENIGRALNYSGTIGAAIEAADFGVPTIAISQQLSYDDMFGMYSGREVFDAASRIAADLTQRLLDCPPEESFYCVNVNVPHGATTETPRELTIQADLNRWVWIVPEKRNFSDHFSVGYEEAKDVEWVPGTDAHALLVNKNISITPITWAIDARHGEYDRSHLEKLIVD